MLLPTTPVGERNKQDSPVELSQAPTAEVISITASQGQPLSAAGRTIRSCPVLASAALAVERVASASAAGLPRVGKGSIDCGEQGIRVVR